MKTFVPKIDSTRRQWRIVDLEGAILGRVAVKVADMLRGKDKPTFTPNLDAGDNVVAVNAAGLRVTGNKLSDKFYYRYTGYPSGLRRSSLGTEMSRRPEELFRRTVRGMLPKNRLGRKMLKKLHVYSGGEQPHSAQKPTTEGLKQLMENSE